MKKPSNSFEIALSAIACAFAAGFLMLGSVVPFMLATGYLVGAFAVMIPLTKKFVRGALLCYLAAGLLAVWVNPINIVPYAVFFGLHPIVNFLQRKYIKLKPLHLVCLLVKTVWFDFSMWLSYFVLKEFSGFVFPELVEQYFYLVLFLGGTLFFIAYDYLIFRCQSSADIVIRRLRR